MGEIGDRQMTRKEWIKEAKYYAKQAELFLAQGDEFTDGIMHRKSEACYANAGDAPE